MYVCVARPGSGSCWALIPLDAAEKACLYVWPLTGNIWDIVAKGSPHCCSPLALGCMTRHFVMIAGLLLWGLCYRFCLGLFFMCWGLHRGSGGSWGSVCLMLGGPAHWLWSPDTPTLGCWNSVWGLRLGLPLSLSWGGYMVVIGTCSSLGCHWPPGVPLSTSGSQGFALFQFLTIILKVRSMTNRMTDNRILSLSQPPPSLFPPPFLFSISLLSSLIFFLSGHYPPICSNITSTRQ